MATVTIKYALRSAWFPAGVRTAGAAGGKGGRDLGKARRPGAYVCGIDAAMDVIGGKWKVLILWALDEGPCRFGELRRDLPGVTEKVLASHLRELVDDGIVHREAFDESPPHVEYSLTPLGVSLNQALEPLGRWGRTNILTTEPPTNRANPSGSGARARLGPVAGMIVECLSECE